MEHSSSQCVSKEFLLKHCFLLCSPLSSTSETWHIRSPLSLFRLNQQHTTQNIIACSPWVFPSPSRSTSWPLITSGTLCGGSEVSAACDLSLVPQVPCVASAYTQHLGVLPSRIPAFRCSEAQDPECSVGYKAALQEDSDVVQATGGTGPKKFQKTLCTRPV